jgi:hypothetical protein
LRVSGVSVAEQVRRRLLDLIRDGLGQRHRLERSVCLALHGGHRQPPARHLFRLQAVQAAEPELVGQAAPALSLDQQPDLHFVFEAQRNGIVALGVDARQARTWSEGCPRDR